MEKEETRRRVKELMEKEEREKKREGGDGRMGSERNESIDS